MCLRRPSRLVSILGVGTAIGIIPGTLTAIIRVTTIIVTVENIGEIMAAAIVMITDVDS